MIVSGVVCVTSPQVPEGLDGLVDEGEDREFVRKPPGSYQDGPGRSRSHIHMSGPEFLSV